MLSFSLVAEALTGLIYHRPTGENSKFLPSFLVHFNVITDNEALAIEIELQNGDKVILATIYCPNGNPSLRLFRMINALSKQVIFLGDFNSKHKQFECVKPNKSGQTLVNIVKDLKLFYVNQLEPNRHT